MDGIDYRDILLEAQADFAGVMKEVTDELALPLMEQALRMKWMTMPDELKEMLRQDQPELYRKITEMVK